MDLVVLDYDMPGIMGDVVAKEMRRLRKDVPLLLVTAFHDLPVTCTSIFDATLVKGESPTVLLEQIGSLLAERQSSLAASRMISVRGSCAIEAGRFTSLKPTASHC